jgi:subtilisin-like proprotein convertase family protein
MDKGDSARTARRSWALAAGVRQRTAALALGLLAALAIPGQAAPSPPSVMARAPAMTARAAAEIATLGQIDTRRNGALMKLDSALHLALLRQRGDRRLAALPRLRTLKPDADGRVLVDLSLRRGGDVAAVLRRLSDLHAPLISSKRIAHDSRTVRTRLALADLESLARLPAVSRIRRGIPARTSRDRHPPLPGPVGLDKPPGPRPGPVAAALNRSEGLRTHGVDDAFAQFGANGGGQRICVLSDGVDSLAASQTSGDLPADLLVLPGQQGAGDEGTAMLEIVHDLAPAARLGFATAFGSAASFAQNILDLAAAGCTVIVDDVLYLDESPWQDGPIAQSVDTVTAAGVSYVSSAGNEGNRRDRTSGTWEGDFRASALPAPAPLAGAGVLHDFGDGGQSLLIEAGSSGTPAVLIWAEHYTLDGGDAATDYNLYLLDGGLNNVLAASTDRQDGLSGDDLPVEFIDGVSTGDRLVVVQAGGPTLDRPPFNLLVFRGEIDALLATAGATRGHSAAAAAYSTAATPAAVADSAITPDGPFPNLFTPVNVTEAFSSDGPRRLLLDAAGNLLTPGNRSYASGGITRRKPDFTAADGVTTSVPGYAPFFGTSAAAPHAAAIAALVRGARPALPAADLRQALTATAIDIEAPGFDGDSGVGIVMPGPALSLLGATPQPALIVERFATAQASGDGDSAIEPGETHTVTLDLRNDGTVPARGIVATLSTSSPEVGIVDGEASYPDLAAGAGASRSTLRFRVGSGLPCGSAVPLRLSVAYNGNGSPLVEQRQLATGSAGTPVSYRYAGPPVAIPDFGAPVSAALTVAGQPVGVRDVTLAIDGSACTTAAGATTVGLDHSYVSDLVVELVGPGGDAAIAIDRAGDGGSNFCQVRLDDAGGVTPIQLAFGSEAPYTGIWTPASPLRSALGGSSDGNGTWALRVQDTAGADSGSIRAWTLNLTSATCDAVIAPPAVTGVDRSGSSPVNATSVGYTVSFDEAVTGVDAGDFRLATSGALSGSVASVSGSGRSYTVTVGDILGSGQLRLDVDNDGSIASVATGTPLAAGYTRGQRYTIDQAAPVATVGVAGDQSDPVTTGPVRFAVTLSELSTDFDADDLILGGTAGATSTAVSGSGLAYEVAVSGMTANGTVTLQVRAGACVDAVGNASAASNVASANHAGVLPTVGYTRAAQTVVEGSGSGSTVVTITATLDAASAAEVSVPVTLGAAGTAARPDDFSLSASRLAFPAGLTVATITATVVRDAIEEADETVVLQLGTPTGAVIGSPATQTVTIVNDDDTTATPFAFTAIAGATPGATVTSAPIVIDGLNQPVAIAITGGSYSIDGAAFTRAAGSIGNGQPVRVRLVASDQFSTLATATLTVGGASASFSVTTTAADSTPGAFSFAPVADAAPGSLQISNAITVAGINTAAAISVTGGRYRVNGGDATSADGTVVAGDTVTVQQNASTTFGGIATATLSIGGVSAGYTVTTRAADRQPDAFSFTDAVDVVPGALLSSNAITIGGIDTAAAIMVSDGGRYSLNGEAFVGTPGTVQAGDRVVVQVTAAASHATPVSTTLTVGSGGTARSDTWTVTTAAAPAMASGGGAPGSAVLASFGLMALWRRRRRGSGQPGVAKTRC